MKIHCVASSLLVFSLLAACQGGNAIKEDAKPAGSSDKQNSSASGSPKPAAISADQGSEKIDPPQNIMGHYLHCAYETKPSDAVAEALVGCRFDNEAGQRVPAASLGSSYKFSSQLPASSGLTVYSLDLSADNRYDVMFLYIGSTMQQVLDGVRRSSISVAVQQVKSTGQDQTISGKFAAIERDAASLPEARNTDYTVVRETILTQARDAGTPPPPN